MFTNLQAFIWATGYTTISPNYNKTEVQHSNRTCQYFRIHCLMIDVIFPLAMPSEGICRISLPLWLYLCVSKYRTAILHNYLIPFLPLPFTNSFSLSSSVQPSYGSSPFSVTKGTHYLLPILPQPCYSLKIQPSAHDAGNIIPTKRCLLV